MKKRAKKKEVAKKGKELTDNEILKDVLEDWQMWEEHSDPQVVIKKLRNEIKKLKEENNQLRNVILIKDL